MTLAKTSPLPKVTAILESVVDPGLKRNITLVLPKLEAWKLMVAKIPSPTYRLLGEDAIPEIVILPCVLSIAAMG